MRAFRDPKVRKRKWMKAVTGASLVVLPVLVIGCAPDVPPVACEDWDFDCFITQAIKGIIVVRNNISYWSNVHLVVQVLIAVFGIVATVMIALQGDDNRHWTRPIGLVATALVTGLTSALVSFHVPENVDKLVDVVANMTRITNEFAYETSKLSKGMKIEDLERLYREDEGFRLAANEATMNFVMKFNDAKIELLKLSGSAAKLQPTGSDSSPKGGATTAPTAANASGSIVAAPTAGSDAGD